MHDISVANIHEFPKDEKGRFILPPHVVYVGRPAHRYGLKGSPLAFPFYYEAKRAQSIEYYSDWLAPRLIGEETPQRREMARLRGLARKGPLILVCFCPAGKPCHAQVICARLTNE